MVTGKTLCVREKVSAKDAPRLGVEPRTYRLTAGRSAIELSGIVTRLDYINHNRKIPDAINMLLLVKVLFSEINIDEGMSHELIELSETLTK